MGATRRHRIGTATALTSVPPAISLNEPLLDVEAAARLLNVKVSWIREATLPASSLASRLAGTFDGQGRCSNSGSLSARQTAPTDHSEA
jgi:hypothetical protein